MRTAIGLIGLGVAGGTIPTGIAGIAHAGIVIGGTTAALALLVGVCLTVSVLARRPRTAKAAPIRAAISPIRSPARDI